MNWTTLSSKIAELIHRRRRQILVHSILYYKFGDSILSDAVFDQWAKELAKLQVDNPEVSESVEYMYEAFKDFAGETGYHLPLHDIRAQRVARHLKYGSR